MKLSFKKPFSRAGFDSILGAGFVVNGGTISIPNGSTFIIDGKVDGDFIAQEDDTQVDKTTVIINHSAQVQRVTVSNVTITGTLKCDLLVVEGLLAIKAGATVCASEIRYRDLHVETGAVICAQMNHLDHISSGERT